MKGMTEVTRQAKQQIQLLIGEVGHQEALDEAVVTPPIEPEANIQAPLLKLTALRQQVDALGMAAQSPLRALQREVETRLGRLEGDHAAFGAATAELLDALRPTPGIQCDGATKELARTANPNAEPKEAMAARVTTLNESPGGLPRERPLTAALGTLLEEARLEFLNIRRRRRRRRSGSPSYFPELIAARVPYYEIITERMNYTLTLKALPLEDLDDWDRMLDVHHKAFSCYAELHPTRRLRAILQSCSWKPQSNAVTMQQLRDLSLSLLGQMSRPSFNR